MQNFTDCPAVREQHAQAYQLLTDLLEHAHAAVETPSGVAMAFLVPECVWNQICALESPTEDLDPEEDAGADDTDCLGVDDLGEPDDWDTEDSHDAEPCYEGAPAPDYGIDQRPDRNPPVYFGRVS